MGRDTGSEVEDRGYEYKVKVNMSLIFILIFKKVKVGKDQFEIITCIGCGAYGKVFQVKHRVSNTIYAMKVVPKDLLIKKNHVRYMNTERNILTRFEFFY